MSSTSQQTRARLDDALVLPFESWENLKAAKSIDVKEVINQLKVAAEAADKLRSFVSSEMPQTSWRSRQELDSLLEKIDKEIQARSLRATLTNLATELERGKVVHRRAARVEQLNQFREQAIKELRTKAAAKGAPAVLPGPEAEEWVDWACALEEPGDGKSLEILRSSFPAVDAFVSHLEPGMWQVDAGVPRPEKSKADEARRDMRERLMSLATELERGSIVHHRAVRVTQLNRLRDESVKELRTQAKSGGAASPLPGPRVNHWVEWACSLKEPDDAEAIESIRTGFPSLDDFVAHMEPNMWVAGAPNASVPAEESQSLAAAAAAGASRSSSSAAAKSAASPMQVPALPVDEDDEGHSVGDWLREKKTSVSGRMHSRKKPGSVENASGENKASEPSSGLKATLLENLNGKRAIIVVAAALLLLAILGTMGWRSHRVRAANNVVSAAGPSASIPDTQANPSGLVPVGGQGSATTEGNLSGKDSANPGAPANTQPASSSSTDSSKQSKPKVETAPSTSETAKPATLNDSQLRTPTAIPKPGKGNTAQGSESAPDMLALAGSSKANPGFAAAVSAPTVKPQFSGGQKEKVPPAVTQGLLLQSVKPVYPLRAQQAHVEGTVVLSAVIARDGSVESVRVLSGHPMLTQAAVDAVKRWRYKPYYLNGEAIPAETEIKIKFAPQ